jgi:glycerol-3-phosphate dehydrogenase (NAD(P)+)
MHIPFKNIVIVGAGAIGTALGQALSPDEGIGVQLLSIEQDVVESINRSRTNSKYFPGFKLNRNLKASNDPSILNQAQVVFLAIPSYAVVDFVKANSQLLLPDTVLVNMAKGFSPDNLTIAETLAKQVTFEVCTMKGPTFARELINGSPTAFTIGAKSKDTYDRFALLFEDTIVYTDYSKDIRGVELLSILKNIYAIALGIVDAQFNSANLRFLFLTRAFNEMRAILLQFGGRKPTMFKYCGFGDFGLTSLNDLSRNRTLGLLIGKGFFNEQISEKVVLEGKIAVNIFHDQIRKRNSQFLYPIISELHKVFNQPYEVQNFIRNILKK